MDKRLQAQLLVKKITGVATLALVVLIIAIYGKDMLSMGGSLAIASQVIFFTILATMTYWVSFGMPHEQKIVLSIGTTTRNIGASDCVSRSSFHPA